MPASKAAGHQRGISRCLIRLTARICVIDRSDTAALPGSMPDTTAGPAADEDTAAGHQRPGSAAGSRLDRALWRAGEVLRRHWLLALLFAAGLVLRVVTQFAYQPALLFFDSKKYMFGTDFNASDWGSYDPIGYTLLLLKPGLGVREPGFRGAAAARAGHRHGGRALRPDAAPRGDPVARRAGRGAGPARRLPAERGTDDHARRAVRGAGGSRDRSAAVAAPARRWASSMLAGSRSARPRRSARSARR